MIDERTRVRARAFPIHTRTTSPRASFTLPTACYLPHPVYMIDGGSFALRALDGRDRAYATFPLPIPLAAWRRQLRPGVRRFATAFTADQTVVAYARFCPTFGPAPSPRLCCLRYPQQPSPTPHTSHPHHPHHRDGRTGWTDGWLAFPLFPDYYRPLPRVPPSHILLLLLCVVIVLLFFCTPFLPLFVWTVGGLDRMV